MLGQVEARWKEHDLWSEQPIATLAQLCLTCGFFEVSARYYDKRYANPYSRPISSRDRYDGNQGRDEAGSQSASCPSIARTPASSPLTRCK